VKPRVLFVCDQNAARSQMAEAFLKRSAGTRFEAHSAGLEKGTLDRHAVEAMREIGFDISANKTKSVDEPEIRLLQFRYVITVCEHTQAVRCPIKPTQGNRISWHFSDPVAFAASDELQLKVTRFVRDRIRAKVDDWLATLQSLPAAV